MSTNTTAPPSILAAPTRVLSERSYACIALVAFVLFLYGDILFSRSGAIVSHVFGDACSAHAAWRQFGFGEIAKGNMPLWNPFLFCGAPFAGNLQSAMFYPVNLVLYTALPLPKAINLDFILHSLLAGFSMLAWMRSRGTDWLAAVLAAAIVMAGTPIFFRINLGQLNVVAVYSWLPLTLLVVDRLFERVSAGWILTGIFAVSMQVLAGYPPAVFNNAVAIGMYCGLRLIAHDKRARTIAAFVPIAVVPLLIGAAPLAAGYHTMTESLRVEGTSYDFATTWSLPPENFLTALMPHFFGDYWHVTYWGRWCLWDVSLYIGIGSLLLLAYGIAYAPAHKRKFAGIMLLLLVVTAMGRYSPFYSLLYHYVPGFSSFRAPSKFLLPALLFAGLLAGLGADEFLRNPRRTRAFATGGIVCAALLCVLGITLQFVPGLLDKPFGMWNLFMTGMEESGEAYPWEPITDMARYDALVLAAVGAFVASGICLIAAFLLSRSQASGKFRTALVCFSIVELLCFCRYARVTTDLDELKDPDLATLQQEQPGDYRVFVVKSFNANWRRNYPMQIGMLTPWGYDPVVLDRYAKFYTYALGGKEHQRFLTYEAAITSILDPISMSLAHGIFSFKFEDPKAIAPPGKYPVVKMPGLFRLTRCKYVYFWPETGDSLLGGLHGLHEVRDPLPRFSIYRNYDVENDRDRMLERMSDRSTDLERTLFLETEPSPRPNSDSQTGPSDEVRLLDEATDRLSVEVKLGSPGILFITDAYSNGWRATALPGSSQQSYEILPANYAFQAIPLAAGAHHIQLAFRPQLVVAGLWVSGISLFIFAVAGGAYAVYVIRRARACLT